MTGILPTDRGTFALLPAFDVSVKSLDLDIPLDSLVSAGEAITRHMDALADELTAILKDQVLAPYLDSTAPRPTRPASSRRCRGCASSPSRRS